MFMTGRRRIRSPHSKAAAPVEAAVLVVGLALSGCAADNGSAPPAARVDSTAATSPSTSSTETAPVPSFPSGEARLVPHLRTVGPQDQDHEVVLHVGDQLDVVPGSRVGGWVVADFPTGVLRMQGAPGAADRHKFLAITVGEGQLTLTPAGPEARSTGVFTFRVRVLRDIVQPPQP
jgi:hypothetical protein